MTIDNKIECVTKFLNFLYQIRKYPKNELNEKKNRIKDQKIDNLTDRIINNLETLLKMYNENQL